MFERQPLASFGRFGAAVCLAYLLPATGLYLLLVILYSNWVNATIILYQAVVLLIFGPPLLALWILSIDRLRHGDKLKALPHWMTLALYLGILATSMAAAYASITYPWLGRLHMGPAFAAIALVASPALIPALLFLKDNRSASRATT
jgi:hypothetical protein